MHIKRIFFRAVVASILALASSYSISDQIPRIVESTEYYEMARVEIENINTEGTAGVLKVAPDPECIGCYEQVPFDERTFLVTPLGEYRSLAKLADWTDRHMFISVRKSDGVAIKVFVESF